MKKTLLAVMAMVSLCGYAQLPVEPFEIWPLTGWTTHTNGSPGLGITWQQSNGTVLQPAYSGAYAAFLDKENVPDGTLAKDWLVTPSFPVTVNAVFRFASRLTINGDQGSIYKLLLLPAAGNPDVLSDYVVLQQWTELELNPSQTDYTLKNVAIPDAYSGQNIRIAFYMEGDDGDGWLVDDVNIFSDCIAPINPLVTNIAVTTAILSWTQEGDATTWEIEVINAGAVPSGIGVTTTENPATVSQTTSGTSFIPSGSYEYYVRAKCADGGNSVWVGPIPFTIGVICPAPTDVTLTEVGLNSLTYSWTPTEATMYDYWVTSVNGAVPNASTVPSGMVVEPTVVIAAVVPGQEYAFYVRAVCGPNNFSPWVGIDGPANPDSNILHGIVRYDSNTDGICNDNDAPLPFAEVQITGNGAPYSVYTNQNGEYTINNFSDGAYTLNLQVVSSVFSTIAPVVQEVTFSEIVNEAEINHCLEQPMEVNDLEVTFIATGVARPGFTTIYKAFVYNAGSTLRENVVLNLSFDSDRITYVSSDLSGVTASAGNLSVAVGDMQPFSAVNGNILFSVMQPPTNIGGEAIQFEASLSDVPNDATPANNDSVLNQIIVNSYDPNDITVHEGNKIFIDQADDYLTYTIRFQNTGTADAVNIKLENTLDELLDWSTFKPIASSHNYDVKRADNLLKFEYNNIFLPDSTANEPGSHGFITYKIKPKAEYGLGDIVSNTAEIYFDFNEAIVTNTATTEVVEITAGLTDKQIAIAKLYPNPVKDQLHIAIQQGELQLVTIRDINGRLCLSANAETIDTSALNGGIYFVKVTTDAGSADYKIIKH